MVAARALPLLAGETSGPPGDTGLAVPRSLPAPSRAAPRALTVTMEIYTEAPSEATLEALRKLSEQLAA